MAFLDFVRSQIGTNPLTPMQKFMQVLQAGAQAVRPTVTDAAPMASGQIVNPLQRFIDAVGAQGTSRIPLVNIGAPSPQPNPSRVAGPSLPSATGAAPTPGPSPAQNFAGVLQRGAQSMAPSDTNAKLRGLNLPPMLSFDQMQQESQLPEALRNRSLPAQAEGLASQPTTRPTTPEDRLSAPVYQPPAWIMNLSASQGQLAAREPDTAMRFVLKNSGIDNDSPAGKYFIERAPAIANLYFVQSGNFSDDGSDPQGLMTYMQAWVDKMTASASSEGQRRFSDNMKQQTAAKADEILRSTAEGTAGWAFRQAVEAELGESWGQDDQGQKPELSIYWKRLILPTLIAKRMSDRTIETQFEIVSDYFNDYEMEQFAGTFSGDFGTYLVQRGYHLSNKS